MGAQAHHTPFAKCVIRARSPNEAPASRPFTLPQVNGISREGLGRVSQLTGGHAETEVIGVPTQ